MKSFLKYLLLLILPAFSFIAFHRLQEAQGEFYLNGRYDPSYVYLVSSLNMAQLVPVVHSDHPGTPLQVIGALVLKTCFHFSGVKEDIAAEVLSRPEFYLNKVSSVLIFINCLVLFIFGIMIYRIFNNIFAAIFLQLTPFSSYTIYYEPSVIATESLLIPVMLLLLAFLFRYVYNNPGKNFCYCLYFSILCGLGIACKITFIPVVFIPLLMLEKFRNKIFFLILTFAFFLVFFLPAISNIGYFSEWIGKLLLYNDLYGGGEPTVVRPAYFFSNIREIVTGEKFFSTVFIAALILLTVKKFILKEKKNSGDDSMLINRVYKLLFAFVIVMLIQILIVAKHFSEHYMLTALMLTIPAMFLILQLSGKIFFEFERQRKNLIYGVLFFIISVFMLNGVIKNYNNLEKEKTEATLLLSYVNNNYPDAVVISSYGSSSKEYAQSFSLTWSGKQSENYRKILSDKLRNNMFYDFWDGRIYSSDGNVIDEKIVGNGKKVIAMLNSKYSHEKEFIESFNKKFNLTKTELVKLFETPKGEIVYEVKIN